MKRSRLLLVLAVVIALVVVPAGAAYGRSLSKPAAGSVHVQSSALPDVWENDDTTATANELPETSLHTFSSSATTADADWSMVTAETTGEPFLFETRSNGGWFDSDLRIYDLNADGSVTELEYDDDSDTWDWSYGSTLFWSAPHPGTFYVKASPHGDDTEIAGEYLMFSSEGLARRIAGADRFATAAAVSRTLWPETNNEWYSTDEGPNAVIIANGYNFPDAEAGAALSAMGRGGADNVPILLVGKDFVPPATAAEFARLQETNNWGESTMTVYVLGGTEAISDSTVQALVRNGSMPFKASDVVRLAGPTRFETAAKIASASVDTFGDPDTVFIATGYNFPDGLAVAPVAGSAGGPVLFSQLATVGPATSQWLLDHPSVTSAVLVGGTAVIDDAVADALAAPPYSLDVTRVAGTDRYHTAHKLAEFGINEYGLIPSMLLVNGNAFPDALTAATLSGNTQSVVMLTQADSLNGNVLDFYADHMDEINPTPDDATDHPASYVIGGTKVITPETFAEFTDMWAMP